MGQTILGGDTLISLGVAAVIAVAVISGLIRIVKGQARMEAAITRRFDVGDRKFEGLEKDIKSIMDVMVTKEQQRIADLEYAIINPGVNVPRVIRLKELAAKHGSSAGLETT